MRMSGIGRQASVLRARVHPHWLRAAGSLKAKLLVELNGQAVCREHELMEASVLRQ